MQVAWKKKKLGWDCRWQSELAFTPFLSYAHYLQKEGACLHTCICQTLYMHLLQWPKHMNIPESQVLEKLVREKKFPNIMFPNVKIAGIL